MINIIIVDDNADKIKNIKEILNKHPQVKNDLIITASDLITAKREISIKRFDLMILDLNLPDRFGDDPQKFSGVNFLHECKLSERLINPYHIIGLTQYEELIGEYKNEFEDELWALILYSVSNNSWEKKLQNKIDYLVQSKEELSSKSIEYKFDIAIITALHTPELSMVLNLDANWNKKEIPNDSTTYYVGSFQTNSKKLNVVAASANQMGMTASAVLSMKLIDNFRPKYIIMAGITAGIHEKTNFGDIIASDISWDYGSGKISCNIKGKTIFTPDPKSIPLDAEIKEKLQTIILEQLYVDEIKQKYYAKKPESSLKLLIGPVASGAAVVQNEQIIEQIKSQQRKVIGIEMESYGVFYAALNCKKPKPKCIILKSVCDFADSNKNDDYQDYAAYTSAQFVYKFSLDYL